MKHKYQPRERTLGPDGYSRLTRIEVTPQCSCKWAGSTHTQSRWEHPYQARRKAEGQHRRHAIQEKQRRRYKTPKRMELVGKDNGKEVWVGYLYGDLPPGFTHNTDSQSRWKKEGIYRTQGAGGWPEIDIKGQLYTGRLYPWVVWKKSKQKNLSDTWRWTSMGCFRTKEEAILSARRKLGKTGTLRVKGTTYTPKVPPFEQYLKRLADEVRAAKTPAQKAKLLKKIRKINAAMELVRQAERELIGLD